MTAKPTPLLQRLPPLPRLSGWLLLTALLLVSVWLIAPQQLPVSLYKLSLVSLAAVVGYWLDRSLFPYARPDVFLALGEVEDVPLDPDQHHHADDCPECATSCATFALATAPDHTLLQLMGISMIRRAVIVGCAMLAMGLGA